MQRFLSRFAWRNLNIHGKVGLLFAFHLFLLILIIGISLVVQSNSAKRTDSFVESTSRAGELTADIQSSLDSLQSIENRLLNDFQEDDFDPDTTVLYRRYSDTLIQLRTDLDELETLVSTPPYDRFDQTLMLDAIDELNANINLVEGEFADVESITERLTVVETGLYDTMFFHSDNLEALTIQQADNITIAEGTSLLRSFEIVKATETGVLTSGELNNISLLEDAVDAYLTNYFSILRDDRVDDIPDVADDYLTSVEAILVQLDLLEFKSDADQLFYSNLFTEASRVKNLSTSQSDLLIEDVVATENQARTISLVIFLLSVFMSGSAMFIFSRSLADIVSPILASTQRIELGNLDTRAPVEGADEFSRLASSFNAMAVQLDGLVSGLEQRVAEATRDLTITSEIGQAVVTLRNPRELMNEVVELIRSRFGFYHAQVFLLDDEHQVANLIASTGTAGRELLARRHSLPVGSQSVIGQVTESGEPVIALDTDTSRVHRKNELLPNTRSEMALPMRIGSDVIGALDVQSVAPNAFDEDDVVVFQIMADQLAIALDNARLYSQLSDVQFRLNALEQNLTMDTWREYQRDRGSSRIGYQLNDEDLAPIETDAPLYMKEAIDRGVLVRGQNGEEAEIAIPIRVRGEVIGAFGFSGENLGELSIEDIVLLEAIMNRVGLALENLRLVEQTTRRAEYEQVVNDITAKIVGSTDVNYILQTTVKELGRVLRAPQTSVQLLEGDQE